MVVNAQTQWPDVPDINIERRLCLRLGIHVEEVCGHHLDEVVLRSIHRRVEERGKWRDGHLGHIVVEPECVEERVLELRCFSNVHISDYTRDQTRMTTYKCPRWSSTGNRPPRR